MPPRRLYAAVLLATVAAGGLLLWAVGRTWSSQTLTRPAPLPAEIAVRSGPGWLTACALVALAAAGALLATRGIARRGIGVVLALAGVAAVVGAAGGASSGHLMAPLLALIAGGILVGCGGLVVARAATWPEMGRKYERPAGKPEDLWGALDRGEDPTVR